MRYIRIKSLPNSKELVDWDELLLHVSFQVLVDAMNTEQIDVQYEYGEQLLIGEEMRFLYQWWQERIKSDDDTQDDEMLMRLMKIRKYLWI